MCIDYNRVGYGMRLEILSKMHSLDELEHFIDLENAFLSEYGYVRDSVVECGNLSYLCSCTRGNLLTSHFFTESKDNLLAL